MSRFLAVLLHGHIPYHIGTCQRADDCYCRPLRFILGRFHEVIQLFMPPGTLVPGWPYALLLFLSFFIFFNAISPRSVGRSPRNFAACSEARSIYKSCSETLGSTQKKFWWQKNMLNLARFQTPFHFERNYLQNK